MGWALGVDTRGGRGADETRRGGATLLVRGARLGGLVFLRLRGPATPGSSFEGGARSRGSGLRMSGGHKVRDSIAHQDIRLPRGGDRAPRVVGGAVHRLTKVFWATEGRRKPNFSSCANVDFVYLLACTYIS